MKRLLLSICVSGLAACAANPKGDDAAFERRVSDESYCVHSARVAQQGGAVSYRSAYLECRSSRGRQWASPQDFRQSAHEPAAVCAYHPDSRVRMLSAFNFSRWIDE